MHGPGRGKRRASRPIRATTVGMSDSTAPGPDPHFFRARSERTYEATRWTRGPWSQTHQHAGPPSALLIGQMEAGCGEPFRVVRCAIEILRPVPIGALSVRLELRRDGRSVKIAEGALVDERGAVCLRAEAMAIAASARDLPATDPVATEPPPDASEPRPFPFFPPGDSYARAMDVRFGRGDFGDGDVMAWLRMRVALVEGRETTALERVLVAADSGSGVSQRLSLDEYTFVNADLTVALHRPLVGEWVGLAARTELDGRGVGLADTRIHDVRGPVGRGLQSLVVRAREG